MTKSSESEASPTNVRCKDTNFFSHRQHFGAFFCIANTICMRIFSKKRRRYFRNTAKSINFALYFHDTH